MLQHVIANELRTEAQVLHAAMESSHSGRGADYIIDPADDVEPDREPQTVKDLIARCDLEAKHAQRKRDALIAYATTYGGLTDADLADALRVSRSTINRIRNGTEPRGDADELFRCIQERAVSDSTEKIINTIRGSDMTSSKKNTLLGAVARADIERN